MGSPRHSGATVKWKVGALPPVEAKHLQIIAMLILKRRGEKHIFSCLQQQGTVPEPHGAPLKPHQCTVLGTAAKLSLFPLLSDILAGFHGIMRDAPVTPFAKHWAKIAG